jgi:plastocyanin
MSKRWFTMLPTAALALVVLAACGGAEAPTEETRVPDAANAPAVETEAPAEEASPEATEEATTDAAASPVAADATPAGARSDDATPVAAAATPTADGAPAAVAATPVAEASSPVAAAATPASEGTPAAGATPEAGAGAGAAQEFTVTSFDIYYEPKELTIPANQDVTVLLPNEGAAPHNFVIDELEIAVEQAPGAQEQTVINAAAGEYTYYCSIPGHRQAGMEGILTVE